MSAFPIIALNGFEYRRIRQGHPWVYEKSLRSVPEGLKTGDQVSVVGPRGEPVGTGLYHAESKIRLRILSREQVTIDEDWFCQRLQEATAYRRTMLPRRTTWRLINSESDGMSGVIIDCYDGACLFQITSAGIEQRKDALIAAMRKVLRPSILIERNDVSNRKFEGLEPILKVHDCPAEGEDLSNYRISLEGVTFTLNLIEGNKTGLYLDQIDNHRRFREVMARYSNARVLDCFSYIGGFSLSAALSGHASNVLGLDQSAECVAKATANAQSNGVGELCRFERANVFDWMREASANPEHQEAYQVIILDPPSFTKNRFTVDGAVRGYKELHVRALKLLAPGGALLTYSCSHHIGGDLLRSIVFEAANDTGSHLIETASHQQSLDHPIVPAIPESYYLKGYVYHKIR